MINLLTAVVRPHTVDAVKDALKEAGFEGITLTEVKGFGRQGGHTETYRGAEYTIDFLPKLKVEVLLPEERVDQAIDAITGAAHSGRIGDGKIWVTEVARTVRIRTGERDLDAV